MSSRRASLTLNQVTTVPTDPDVTHLADLLNLLPGPEDRDFWERVAGKGEPPNEPGRTSYVIRNLVVHMPAFRKSDPQSREIARLVTYLMMFFGGDPRGLHELIGRRFPFVAGSQYETLGELWLKDLIATCWRLYVRHHGLPPHERLTAWPDDSQAWIRDMREEI